MTIQELGAKLANMYGTAGEKNNINDPFVWCDLCRAD